MENYYNININWHPEYNINPFWVNYYSLCHYADEFGVNTNEVEEMFKSDAIEIIGNRFSCINCGNPMFEDK